jgi:hypothetical protein
MLGSNCVNTIVMFAAVDCCKFLTTVLNATLCLAMGEQQRKSMPKVWDALRKAV